MRTAVATHPTTNRDIKVCRTIQILLKNPNSINLILFSYVEYRLIYGPEKHTLQMIMESILMHL